MLDQILEKINKFKEEVTEDPKTLEMNEWTHDEVASSLSSYAARIKRLYELGGLKIKINLLPTNIIRIISKNQWKEYMIEVDS